MAKKKIAAVGKDTSMETAYRIERFLAAEARVLDEERYDDWLSMLDESITYKMPIPMNTYRRNRPGSSTICETMIYDESFEKLKQRAAREDTGMVWLNDPATRHIRTITNIESFCTDEEGVYDVRSKFTLLRSRRDKDHISHSGTRQDFVRDSEEGLKLISRMVFLPERVIVDKNLNMFF
ncbi:MAG: 3-phenylpropionate/cinnamic acid dioxygenase subunit beta [Cycloclasticus sp.]|nr:aromatic-ring-hydroxylating dioxygenase subunit beta [Cycloclasticus sp. 44_32_T64]